MAYSLNHKIALCHHSERSVTNRKECRSFHFTVLDAGIQSANPDTTRWGPQLTVATSNDVTNGRQPEVGLLLHSDLSVS